MEDVRAFVMAALMIYAEEQLRLILRTALIPFGFLLSNI